MPLPVRDLMRAINRSKILEIIRTTGMFSEGGKAELHLSDDPRHLLVYLKTELPVIGISMTMQLTSLRDGAPVHGGPATNVPLDRGR